MKKIRIMASLAVLMIVAAVIIRYVMGSKAEYTEESIPTIAFTDFDGDGLVKDLDADFGSEANPLLVLEIVPVKSMAEFGYLISGSEPIDMSLLPTHNDIYSWYQGKFINTKMATDHGIQTEYKFPDELGEGDTIVYGDGTTYPYYMMPSWTTNWQLTWGLSMDEVIGEGAIHLTSSQSPGNFGEWVYSGDKEVTGHFEKVPEGTGSYVLGWVQDWSAGGAMVQKCLYVGKNKGNYDNWVTAENTNNIPTNENDDIVWTKRSGVMYSCKQYKVSHNDVLLKECFGADADGDSICSQVITLTPYELRKSENLALIADADLISIHGKAHDGMLSQLWEKYNNLGEDGKPLELTEEEKKRSPSGMDGCFDNNDFTWETVLTIVARMASDDPPGIIMDDMVEDSNAVYNYQKLSIMLCQSSPTEFQTCFLDTGKVKEKEYIDSVDGYDLRTGVYHKDVNGTITQISTWGQTTFYEYTDQFIDGDASKGPNYKINLNFTQEERWGAVRNKVYIYKGNMDMFNDYLNPVEVDGWNMEAFEYYDDIGEPKDGLTGNLIVRYLLQDTVMKRELKILEVQPCNKFIYGEEGWQEYYVQLFPWLEGKLEKCVKVTTMPTWQFNSSIQDLNSEYDVIIFGIKQDVSNGLNGYNDSAMNTNKGKGLIYTSIGDIVNLNEHDQAMRYSGNDITAKKVKELESFMNGNKAVILDSGFMRRGVGNGVNTDVIDPSSNIYKFASMHKKEVEGVNTEYLFVYKQYNANTLRKAVAYETCRIEFVPYKVSEDYMSEGYPIEYTYQETKDNDKAIAKGSVTYADRNFQYSFKIRGKVGTVYEIGLFVDVNGDGLYNDSDSNRIEGTEKATERVGGIVVYDENGNVVDPNKLTANTNYVLTKNLENTYQGIIPWKLEAHIVNNTDSRNNVVKYAALKTTDATKKRISVLLMNPTPDMSEPDVFYGKYASWVRDTSRNYGFIRMDQINKFRTYLDAVDEYEITLDYLSNTKWLEKFKNNVAAWIDYLDSYDMLILGFNDNCTFTNNDVFYQGFVQFKDSGKSVIMSHDMVKDTSENTNLRVKFDEELRQMMGQRRFSQNTIMLNNNSVNLLFTKEKYKDYNKKIDENNTWPGYFDNANRLFVSRGAGKADRDSFAPLGAGWTDQNKETQYINIVNRGQITNYPYDIPDLIQVANTHAQNYQLDLENKDMAVWYTLTDQYTKTYADEAKNIMGENAYNSAVTADKIGRGTYSSVECDGRNSYYIYNINNVTYTGLGHKTNMTDQEIKLFVNTMIAAYRSRPIPPGIEITNEDAIIEGSSATIYVPFDSNLDYEESMIDVCYKVTDPSLLELTNRTYELEYKDVTGITLKNIITYPIIDGVKSATKVTGVPSARTPVKRDGEYYFQVPYSEIKDGSKTYQLTLWYADPGNTVFKQAKTVSVTIMQMPMFNLS